MSTAPVLFPELSDAQVLEALALAERAYPLSQWYCDRADCDGKPHDDWVLPHARTQQHPPTGEWLLWLVQAGRGGGKTRTAAELVIDRVRTGRARTVALVARTPADARDVMVEGPGGILQNSPPGFRPDYQPTKRRLIWPNGAQATTYSAEAPSQLRGPEHDLAWADEVAAWSDARKGDVIDTAWNNLMLGLRIGEPQCVVTTTPKPNALTRVIRANPATRISQWATYDNLSNLAPSFRAQILSTYEGTRIGKQELMGELLADVEGALWSLIVFDDRQDEHGTPLLGRVTEVPECSRVAVGVDPTGSDSSGADECGILVVGKGMDGHGYTLADRTITAGPAEWARRAVAAYREFAADKIVAEINYGGLMVVETIKAVDKTVPVEVVTASRSKRQRAEPVAAMYEQGRVHHVGVHAKLEDELTTWTPESGWSPGRMDALVWAVSWLNLAGGASLDAWIQSQRERLARTPEEQAAAVTAAGKRAGIRIDTSRCTRSNDGHHRFDGDRCMACGLVKEAVA
jgi:phage terminase large subunit-like protein